MMGRIERRLDPQDRLKAQWSRAQVEQGLDSMAVFGAIVAWQRVASTYFIDLPPDSKFLQLDHAQAREFIRGHRLALNAVSRKRDRSA